LRHNGLSLGFGTRGVALRKPCWDSRGHARGYALACLRLGLARAAVPPGYHC